MPPRCAPTSRAPPVRSTRTSPSRSCRWRTTPSSPASARRPPPNSRRSTAPWPSSTPGHYGVCSRLRQADRRAPPAGPAVFRPLHHLRGSGGLTTGACPPTRPRCASSATSCTTCSMQSAHYRALGRDDINAELIEGVLEGAARFAEDVVAPTNEAGRSHRRAPHRRRPRRHAAGFRGCLPPVRGGRLGGAVRPARSRRPGPAGKHRRGGRRDVRLRQHVVEALQRPDRQRGAVPRQTRRRSAEARLPAEARERRVERHDGADRAARGHRPRPHAHARRTAAGRAATGSAAPRSSSPAASTT